MLPNDLINNLPQLALSYGLNILLAVLVLVIGNWLIKKLVRVARHLLDQQGVNTTVVRFLGDIIYICLLAMVIIAALAQLGIPTASFIAVIGAMGLAIGLALQGSLSNFASGLILVSFRPCEIGDYIEAAGQSGSVDAITLFSTTLITPDRRTITIPNSSVLSGAIINYTTSTNRRLDLVIGVAYESDIPKVKELLEKVVRRDARVLLSEPIQIGVLELAESSVNIAVRQWVQNKDYTALRFDLLEAIKLDLDEAGVKFPYPHREVVLQQPLTLVS